MMERFQQLRVDGRYVHIKRKGWPEEVHAFPTPEEAAGRAAIVCEAFTWIGTPFVDCGDIKGPNGAVDCAMLAVRCYVDTGRLPPFDPRPYPPRWHLHQGRERFLEVIEDQLHAVRTETPQLGDVAVWRFGRTYSHGGLIVNSREVVHAFFHEDMCTLSRRDEHVLSYISDGSCNFPRPVRYYDVWSA